jgi:hypothetical protein
MPESNFSVTAFLVLSNVGHKLRDTLARGVRKHDP